MFIGVNLTCSHQARHQWDGWRSLGPVNPGRLYEEESDWAFFLAAMAARSSDANPAMRRLFSSGMKARPIQQKRKPAKDKRRNEAREFGVDGVRAQRAKHEGDQDRRSGSSPPGN